MEKKMNELSEREVYEVEGGAMVSYLDNMPDGGAGNVIVDEKPASATGRPLGQTW